MWTNYAMYKHKGGGGWRAICHGSVVEIQFMILDHFQPSVATDQFEPKENHIAGPNCSPKMQNSSENRIQIGRDAACRKQKRYPWFN